MNDLDNQMQNLYDKMGWGKYVALDLSRRKYSSEIAKNKRLAMTYDEAKEYSFQVPWKATECFSGPDCWCRIIVPVEPIFYTHPESDTKYEYSILDAGALDQETAEYFVKLHNERLEKNKIISDAFNVHRSNKDFESNI